MTRACRFYESVIYGEYMNRFISAVIVLLGLAGYAHGNEKPINEYMRDGVAAQERGDWDEARRIYALAFSEGNLAQADPRFRAVLHYEYGRSLGVTCSFDEAERQLNLANDLDKHTGGVFYLSLTELARLNLDQRKFAEAVAYLERVMAELDPVITARRVPIFYANVLEDYAMALSGIGRETDAEAAAKRAAEVRGGTPKEQFVFDRTPYGKHCPKS